MKRAVLTVMALGLGLALAAWSGLAQPPGGREGNGEGRRPGPLPKRFELGQVLPPPLIDELNLTAAQERELDGIRSTLKSRLGRILTGEQKRTVEDFRPRGPGGAGRPPGPPGFGGPNRFELGQVLPRPLIEDLNLTPAQESELAAIRDDLKDRLNGLLTDEQKKTVANFRPRIGGPGAPGRGPRPIELGPDPSAGARTSARLVVHGRLKPVGDTAFPFTVLGDAVGGVLGDARLEQNGGGVRLLSGDDFNHDGKRSGECVCTLTGVERESGRWYRINVYGLAQPQLALNRDELYIKVEFFKDQGRNSLDFIKKSIYAQVQRERESLIDSRTNRNLGPATWRNYSIDVRTPFPDVDTLKVSVGFSGGAGKARQSEFWVGAVDVSPIPDPAEYRAPAVPAAEKNPPALERLVRLGGRWYFDPRGGSEKPPEQFDRTNADRLYYRTDRLEPVFAGNTSAWLRRGFLDYEGRTVRANRFQEDAVVISFTKTHLVMMSKNLPNHPVAVFPDRTRYLDGNPNVIQEQRNTWYIPLEPRPNPDRPAAMTLENKRGLPMGPIGVAVNGVVFFNPFDHIAEADAVWRLDRCCGHPSPANQYHYHKYPVCVNTPWADDGDGHSPLLGFAFDGFPVYGPYDAAGELAKDSKNRLNEYNLHSDDARGAHYHVTPGKFPHIIGGYWGVVDSRNRPFRRGPPN